MPLKNQYARASAAALFFLLATAVMTYPLAFRLWDTVPFHVDPLFLTWTLDWEWHQLFIHPLALFDANIFWPYHGTLAYSELALPDLAVFGPVEALTGNPIAAFNVTLFAVIALSGFCAYLLGKRLLQGDEAPALAAGILFAFCQYRWGQYIHIQMMSTLWIPLTFLFADRYLRGVAASSAADTPKRRPRDAALCVLCFVLQALSSFYMGLFLAADLALYVIVRQWRDGLLPWRQWAWLGGFGLLGGILMAPLVLPYFGVASSLGFVRSVRDAVLGGAALNSFIRPAAGSLVYDRLLPLGRALASPALPVQEDAFFPGVIALLLAAVGLRTAWRKGARFFALMALSGMAISLGPYLLLHDGQATRVPLPYLLLYLAVPGFRSIRLPARAALLMFLWLGVLAGFGLRWLARWSRLMPAVAIGLLLLDNLAVPRPAVAVPVGGDIPAVYQWLAHQPDEPIVELPIAPSRYDESTYPLLAGYEYFQTYHRHRSVVGYSSFTPPLYFELIDRMASFPDLASLSFLRGEGVRYVLVHNSALTPAKAEQIAARVADFGDDLELAGRWGSDTAYLLRPGASTPVKPESRVALASAARPGQPYALALQFLEPSESAYLLQAEQQLALEVEWQPDAGASPFSMRTTVDLPLAYTQGVTNLAVKLTAPPQPGHYTVHVRGSSPTFTLDASGHVQVGLEAPVSPLLRLVTMETDRSSYQAGDEVFLTLGWNGAPADRLTQYLQLVDSQNRRWATDDSEPFDGLYPTTQWSSGHPASEVLGVKLPARLPPGQYRLETGWYAAADGQPWEWMDPAGRRVTSLVVAAVQVTDTGPPPFSQTSLRAGSGPAVDGLLGADMVPADGKLEAGDPLGLIVFRTPGAKPEAGEIRLVDGRTGAVVLAAPLRGTESRELVNLADTGRLRGSYLVRLHTASRNADLGVATFASPAPESELAGQPPPEPASIRARYPGLELVGVTHDDASVSLIWHVSAPMARPLTVFVHVLDGSGRLVAQNDSQPVQGRLPLTDWVPGTYVVDRHSVEGGIPPSARTVEIGLYDPVTGLRYAPAPGLNVLNGAVRLSLSGGTAEKP